MVQGVWLYDYVHAAPLVKFGEPVMKIKTTKFNSGASFRLFTKYNPPPENNRYTEYAWK